MQGRAALTHQEFGEKFFPTEEASVAARVRAILQEWVGIDLSRAIPEDELVGDLGLGSVDGLTGVHMIHEVENEFHCTLDMDSRPSIVTIRDLVETMAAQLRRQEAG